jgi:hypothetical protein
MRTSQQAPHEALQARLSRAHGPAGSRHFLPYRNRQLMLIDVHECHITVDRVGRKFGQPTAMTAQPAVRDESSATDKPDAADLGQKAHHLTTDCRFGAYRFGMRCGTGLSGEIGNRGPRTARMAPPRSA